MLLFVLVDIRKQVQRQTLDRYMNTDHHRYIERCALTETHAEVMQPMPNQSQTQQDVCEPFSEMAKHRFHGWPLHQKQFILQDGRQATTAKSWKDPKVTSQVSA